MTRQTRHTNYRFGPLGCFGWEVRYGPFAVGAPPDQPHIVSWLGSRGITDCYYLIPTAQSRIYTLPSAVVERFQSCRISLHTIALSDDDCRSLTDGTCPLTIVTEALFELIAHDRESSGKQIYICSPDQGELALQALIRGDQAIGLGDRGIIPGNPDDCIDEENNFYANFQFVEAGHVAVSFLPMSSHEIEYLADRGISLFVLLGADLAWYEERFSPVFVKHGLRVVRVTDLSSVERLTVRGTEQACFCHPKLPPDSYRAARCFLGHKNP